MEDLQVEVKKEDGYTSHNMLERNKAQSSSGSMSEAKYIISVPPARSSSSTRVQAASCIGQDETRCFR